ncbi:hypothetical protein [Streptomyces sp. NPDC047718]|uniref:hypothetical protein n=1 Tax=Streptomyces sp. NPDC047718 TaxID=3155479 RepID=UPI0033D8D7BA
MHTGRIEEARAHVAAGRAARMQDISPHHAFPPAAAAALAATEKEADAAYPAAYAVPGASSRVFELARLRLAHGSWLHRRHRTTARRTARRPPGVPWPAGRPVAAALRPGTARGRHPVDAPAAGPEPLTGRELRIARLAAHRRRPLHKVCHGAGHHLPRGPRQASGPGETGTRRVHPPHFGAG